VRSTHRHHDRERVGLEDDVELVHFAEVLAVHLVGERPVTTHEELADVVTVRDTAVAAKQEPGADRGEAQAHDRLHLAGAERRDPERGVETGAGLDDDRS